MTDENTNAVVEESQPLGETQETQEVATEEVSQPSYRSVSDSIAEEIEGSDETSGGLDDTDSSDSEGTEDVDISDDELDAIIDEVIAEDGTDDIEMSNESDGDTKSNTQKRIDQLTAEKKSERERADKLEAKLEKLIDAMENQQEVKSEETKSDKITDTEILNALHSYMEEGDYKGILDIINYKVKTAKDDMKNEYLNEKRRETEEAKRKQAEWQTIVKDYSPDSYDEDILRDDPDFNLADQNSQLYKLASKLYIEAINSGKLPNEINQKEFVERAFKALLLNKMKGKKSPKTKTVKSESEGLENRLAKEQRKRSAPSGSSGAGEKTKEKQQSAKSELEEVIAERQSQKRKRM